eukprot:scaffold372187_cov13-Prasinocladus_malaysianus.AAC.1
MKTSRRRQNMYEHPYILSRVLWADGTVVCCAQPQHSASGRVAGRRQWMRHSQSAINPANHKTYDHLLRYCC